jgi:hypothetical protein
MGNELTDQFRIFQRASGVWYIEDRRTRHQESLRTRVEAEAVRLLQARNEANRMPAVNLLIARAYVGAADPKMAQRTWAEVTAMRHPLKLPTTKDHSFVCWNGEGEWFCV